MSKYRKSHFIGKKSDVTTKAIEEYMQENVKLKAASILEK